MRGVAGFSKDQAYPGKEIWQNPDAFSKHMQRADFNNQVRSLQYEGIADEQRQQKALSEAAKKLGFGTCANCSWKMRHDNHGILMYEKTDSEDCLVENHLLDGMSLLSFCPIF